MRRMIPAGCLVLVLFTAVSLNGQKPALATESLSVKWVRDSEEYSVLARQVYRVATSAVESAAKTFPKGSWAVSLDIDETALDNSTYQLERGAYGLPYDGTSFNAWVMRRESPAVPGAVDFVKRVRELGGRIVWISNRDVPTVDATRANLAAVGLWDKDDRLCLQNDSSHSKRARRAEVLSGQGACSWAGAKVQLIAFVGDQLGDFPGADEGIPNAGTDVAFGRTCFLLPNPMYGPWTERVTRKM